VASFVRTSNDLAHPFIETLSDQNGPIDLQANDVVTFESRRLGDTLSTTNATAVVVAPGVPVGHPQRGMVEYDPIAQDVANFGIYFIKWRVQFYPNPNTVLQSFPEGSWSSLILLPSV
jgi:hypothetical protein